MKKETITKTAVPALDRSVNILNIVCHNNYLSAAEITKMAKLPRSSAHTLLTALVEQGLLYKTPEQRYTMGGHIMHWANGFLEQKSIVKIFQNEVLYQPLLSRFSLTLTYLDNTEVVCMACHNGDERLGFTFRLGLRLPAGFAATGKAMLSTISDKEVQALYQDAWHEPLTHQSSASCKALLSELSQTRKRGYSIDDREIRDGMFCIGVPIFDHTHEAKYGLALSMQKMDAKDETVEAMGNFLRKMAVKISNDLGYRAI